MSVYVDDMRATYGRMIMCHMMADTLDELHEMVDKIGVNRRWFQGDHYDIAKSKRALAIKNGAIEVDQAYMVGLRKRLRENRNAEICECGHYASDHHEGTDTKGCLVPGGCPDHCVRNCEGAQLSSANQELSALRSKLDAAEKALAEAKGLLNISQLALGKIYAQDLDSSDCANVMHGIAESAISAVDA